MSEERRTRVGGMLRKSRQVSLCSPPPLSVLSAALPWSVWHVGLHLCSSYEPFWTPLWRVPELHCGTWPERDGADEIAMDRRASNRWSPMPRLTVTFAGEVKLMSSLCKDRRLSWEQIPDCVSWLSQKDKKKDVNVQLTQETPARRPKPRSFMSRRLVEPTGQTWTGPMRGSKQRATAIHAVMVSVEQRWSVLATWFWCPLLLSAGFYVTEMSGQAKVCSSRDMVFFHFITIQIYSERLCDETSELKKKNVSTLLLTFWAWGSVQIYW